MFRGDVIEKLFLSKLTTKTVIHIVQQGRNICFRESLNLITDHVNRELVSARRITYVRAGLIFSF